MSNPPEPSSSSRAWTLTRTSSPNSTGPVVRGYETHGSPSTSIRSSPSRRSTTAVTVPRRRLSGIRLARDVDEREGHVDHSLEIRGGDVLVGRVDLGHPVREVHASEAALVEDVGVCRAAAELEGRLVPRALETQA